MRITSKTADSPTLVRPVPRWTAVLACGHSVIVDAWIPPWSVLGADVAEIPCPECEPEVSR